MTVQLGENSVDVHLTAYDTWTWAHRAGQGWPCSTLAGKTVEAVLDTTGLVELTVTDYGGRAVDGEEIDGQEFNALIADTLDGIPESHPVWFVAVGQFK